MAELLFTSPSELAETTILGANVDIDKYTFTILSVQISVIEPLLGTLLYDKIVADLTADTLAGSYLTLYTNFVKPITKNEAIGEYIEVASYILDNGGLYKHNAENAEVVTKDEAQFLAAKYHNLAQMYVQRFNKWICKNPLPEYRHYQEEVNANRNVSTMSGWYFGGTNNDEDDKLSSGFDIGDFLESED